MGKLEKLTTKQVKLMAQVRDEWVALAFSGKPHDEQAIRDGVKWIYEFSKLKAPITIIVDSPLGAQYAANMLKGISSDQVRDQVWDQVRDQVMGEVWAQVRDQVGGQVGGQVGAQVMDQVRAQVWAQVRGQVMGQVGGQVRDQVMGEVWAQVMGQVGDQVRDQVMGQVRDQKLDLYEFSFYGNYTDYGWLSFYDFFERIGILNHENLKKYRTLIQSGVYDMIQLDGLCIVATRPMYVKKNAQGFLHSDTNPAIEWRDGYKIHYLNGVSFPDALWNEVVSGEMPFEKIMAIEDIDQRTQAMKYGDREKFLEHSKAEKLDEYLKFDPEGRPVVYRLYRIPQGEIFREDAYFVVYDCPSTGRVYMSGVEKCEKVEEAMAWKFQISAEEWKKMQPLIHES